MPIASLPTKAPKAAKAKSAITVISIEGDLAKKYNEAVEAEKTAKADKDVIGAELKARGFSEIADINVASPVYTNSIRLEDETDASVLFSLSSAYNDADPAAVNDVFESLGLDAGEFAQQTYKPAFDEAAFLNKDGDFDMTRFEAFSTAINKVAAKLGITNPLSAKPVLRAKPGFHEKRWKLANVDAAAQVAIQEVMPIKVSLKK